MITAPMLQFVQAAGTEHHDLLLACWAFFHPAAAVEPDLHQSQSKHPEVVSIKGVRIASDIILQICFEVSLYEMLTKNIFL